jgi:hypothetical protein
LLQAQRAIDNDLIGTMRESIAQELGK